MKTLIEKIKALFLKYKTIILVAITALIFSMGLMYQCSENVTQRKADKAEQALNDTKIRNEVQNYYLQRENAKLDSLKSVEAAKTFKLQTDNIILKSDLNKTQKSSANLEEKYKKLVSENAPCPDLLNAAIERIDTLKSENKTLIKIVDNSDIQIKSLTSQLSMCETQSTNKDTLLIGANNEIKALNTVIYTSQKLEKKKQFKQKITTFFGSVVIVAETVLLLIRK